MANNIKLNNVKGLFSNGKSLMIIIFVVVIMVGSILTGAFSLSKGGKENKLDQGTVNSAQPINAEVLPGENTTAEYNKLIEDENKKKAAAALQNGETALPILTAKPNTIETLDVIAPVASGVPVTESQNHEASTGQTTLTPVPEMVQQKVEPVKVAQSVAPLEVFLPQELVEDRSGNRDKMKSELEVYMEGWGPVTGRSETEYGAGNGNVPTNGFSGSTAANSRNAASPAVAEMARPLFYKAGEIVPAVLITGMNSDEPSPVLAEIVAGPLKGSRLIGKQSLGGPNSEAMLIQFTTLSNKKMKSSVTINAYAVDPDTSRTVMASDVDHHYFQRYGFMFAAAFIKGYSEASKNSGALIAKDVTGATITSYPAVTAQQAQKAAMGEVATAFTSTLTQSANRKPTITVPAGAPMGLLFMTDF